MLAHRKPISLGPDTRVYCYRVGTLDSCLGVLNGGETIFNVNDAQLNADDGKAIVKDIGPVEVLLNQFSVAVYNGDADHGKFLTRAAKNKMENLSANHANLGARVTIPFASLMYFSAIDNRYMNEFTNKPRDVLDFCAARGQTTAVLYPGDEYTVNQPYDSSAAIARYDELYSAFGDAPYDVPPRITISELAETFHAFVKELRRHYPRILLRYIRPLRVEIPDLGKTVEIAIARDSFEPVSVQQPDAVIYSQPLQYCFAKPWGLQTLTISARFVVLKNARTWRIHKALFALNGAEVYLRPRYLFKRRNWNYLRDRVSGQRRYSNRPRRMAADVRQLAAQYDHSLS
ncbi:MAG: hypothetical protein ACREP6_04560 [Candidatus Binataceae bacterium]